MAAVTVSPSFTASSSRTKRSPKQKITVDTHCDQDGMLHGDDIMDTTFFTFNFNQDKSGGMAQDFLSSSRSGLHAPRSDSLTAIVIASALGCLSEKHQMFVGSLPHSGFQGNTCESLSFVNSKWIVVWAGRDINFIIAVNITTRFNLKCCLAFSLLLAAVLTTEPLAEMDEDVLECLENKDVHLKFVKMAEKRSAPFQAVDPAPSWDSGDDSDTVPECLEPHPQFEIQLGRFPLMKEFLQL